MSFEDKIIKKSPAEYSAGDPYVVINKKSITSC